MIVTVPSQNYDPIRIEVQFLVLHYSATSLRRTLQLFTNPNSNVSSHYVIAEDGIIYNVVPCEESCVLKAWHAGHSMWTSEDRTWTTFNNHSIGIELINLNGNVFFYPPEQLKSLYELVILLKQQFPAFRNPKRIIGHEHIAGFRGKIDPGFRFDWKAFYEACYRDQSHPIRNSILNKEQASSLTNFLGNNHKANMTDATFWEKLNSRIEKRYDIEKCPDWSSIVPTDTPSLQPLL